MVCPSVDRPKFRLQDACLYVNMGLAGTLRKKSSARGDWEAGHPYIGRHLQTYPYLTTSRVGVLTLPGERPGLTLVLHCLLVPSQYLTACTCLLIFK